MFPALWLELQTSGADNGHPEGKQPVTSSLYTVIEWVWVWWGKRNKITLKINVGMCKCLEYYIICLSLLSASSEIGFLPAG